MFNGLTVNFANTLEIIPGLIPSFVKIPIRGYLPPLTLSFRYFKKENENSKLLTKLHSNNTDVSMFFSSFEKEPDQYYSNLENQLKNAAGDQEAIDKLHK